MNRTGSETIRRFRLGSGAWLKRLGTATLALAAWLLAGNPCVSRAAVQVANADALVYTAEYTAPYKEGGTDSSTIQLVLDTSKTYFFAITGMSGSSDSYWFFKSTGSDGWVDRDDYTWGKNPELGVKFTSEGSYVVRVEIYKGNWVQAHRFNVTVILPNRAPPVPEGLSCSNSDVTKTSAKVNWGKSTDPDGDSVTYVYEFREHGAAMGADYPWWSITDKQKGTTTKTYVNLSELKPGQTYDFRIKAKDSKGKESDWQEKEELFKTKPQQPDLVVTKVWTVPEIVYKGESFVIKATVKNQGDKGVDYGNTAFYVGGQKVDEPYITPRIPAGQSAEYTSKSLTRAESGTVKIRAVADSQNNENESDENNNEREISVTVRVRTGGLHVTLKNQNGDMQADNFSPENVRFHIYAKDHHESGNPATFNDLEAGITYEVEGRYHNLLESAEEYWGTGAFTVTKDICRNVEIIRKEPYAAEVGIFRAGDNTKVNAGQKVGPGEALYATVKIKNNDKTMPVKLELLRSASASGVGTVLGSLQILNCGVTSVGTDYRIDFNVLGEGTVYYRVRVKATPGQNEVLTDAWAWDNNNRFVSEGMPIPDAEIVEFTPPPPNLNVAVGDIVYTKVKVRNNTASGKKFWVGLSFIAEDSSYWLDAFPIQTPSIPSAGVTEVTVPFVIPNIDRMRNGRYHAVARTWLGFDQTRFEMINGSDSTLLHSDKWENHADKGLHTFVFTKNIGDELGAVAQITDYILNVINTVEDVKGLVTGSTSTISTGIFKQITDVFNPPAGSAFAGKIVKPLVYVGFEADADVPVAGAIGVSAGASMGIVYDLADILALTPEGQEGWVTIWLDMGGALGISAGASAEVDVVKVGILFHGVNEGESAVADYRLNITAGGESGFTLGMPGVSVGGEGSCVWPISGIHKGEGAQPKSKFKIDWGKNVKPSKAARIRASGEVDGLIGVEIRKNQFAALLRSLDETSETLQDYASAIGSYILQQLLNPGQNIKLLNNFTFDDGDIELPCGNTWVSLRWKQPDAPISLWDSRPFAHRYVFEVKQGESPKKVALYLDSTDPQSSGSAYLLVTKDVRQNDVGGMGKLCTPIMPQYYRVDVPGVYYVSVAADANTGFANARLVLTDDNGSIPPQNTELKVSPSRRVVEWASASSSFTVSNAGGDEMAWSATVIQGNWVNIPERFRSGTNTGKIWIAIDENPEGGAERTAVIRVTAAGAAGSPVDVQIVQEARPVVLRAEINVFASPTVGGTVSGGGEHEVGQEVPLVPLPNPGRRFKQWSDGNTDNPRWVTVPEGGASYTAVFEEIAALPVVTVTASDANAGEPSNDGAFTFARTGTTESALTVYFTVGGTAESGSDYTALGSSATIPAGAASVTKAVVVINDAIIEASETVMVTLQADTAYTVGSPATATVTIADDDSTQPPPVSGDPVTVEGNAMWNRYAYFSWRNIRHVYQPDSNNAVIDTWKVDDNGNGDPRDDENRILLNGQTDTANGIKFGNWGNDDFHAEQSGWNVHAYTNAAGEGVVEFTRDIGGISALARYMLKLDSGDLYGEFTHQSVAGGDIYWGLDMINSVWVMTNPGEMSLYNRCYLNGEEITARSTALDQVPVRGEDYLDVSGVTFGVSALFSDAKAWTNAFVLTEASQPVTLRSDVQTASEFSGWGFDRRARAVTWLEAGAQITLKAVFKADSLSPSQPSDSNVVFSEDWESGQIDTAKWKIWGSPAPTIVAGGNSIGNYALTSNGDANWESGVTSLQSFEVKPGLTVRAKIFVQSTGTDVWSKRSWHALELTSRPPGEWGNSHGAGDEPVGPYIFLRGNTPTMIFVADPDAEGGTTTFLADSHLDKWTDTAFTFNADGSVTYFVDGAAFHTTRAGWIDYGNVPDAWLVVGGRSEGPDVTNLHDDISVSVSGPATTTYQVAVYGETAGFIITNHAEFAESYRINSWNGGQFDADVGRFTAPEIDVICIGGDDTFNAVTAQAVEAAVRDDGKILLVNFWSNRKFGDSLPAVNGGSVSEGTTMTVTDTGSPVFAGMPSMFTRQHSTDFNREFLTAKPGSTVLMEYADGSPALLYWRYGRGWVIQWASEQMGGFIDAATLDTINHRLLTMLLTAGGDPQPAADNRYQVAVYGETAGFIVANHAEFAESYHIDCWNGATFDANIGRFTAPEIDVICIGGDDTFSAATAQAVEAAVRDNGKILLVNFWSNRKFGDSLPAANGGSAPEGTTMTVTDTASPVFAGMPAVFERQHGNTFYREAAVAKPGSTVLMEYADGSPALLYWRYGRGWVVEWTSEQMGGFIDAATLDTINHRLLTTLLARSQGETALQGTASAGSVGTYLGVSHPASDANDGDPDTGWCNSWNMPDWLQLDFGAVKTIGEVGVIWGLGTHNQTYSISLSEDGESWTVAVPSRVSATDAGYDGGNYHGSTGVTTERFLIAPTRARYIRLDVTATSAPSSHIFKAIVHELLAFEVGGATVVETHMIAASASPAAGGSVAGGGVKAAGSSCTVAAAANNGFSFVNWTEGGAEVSATASYTFTVAGDRTLVANFAETLPEELQNGVPVVNLAGAAGSVAEYKLLVPDGVTKLQFTISGGTGDTDIYVKQGARAALDSYDYRPWLNGNNEVVVIDSPAAGEWYVLLHGYTAYSGVTLLASYVTGDPGGQDDFESSPLGAWPIHWIPDGNAHDAGNSKVVSDPADSGNNVLQLYGLPGNYWEAIAYLPAEIPDDFILEVRVYNGTDTIPASGHQSRTSIGLMRGTDWTGYGRGLLSFDKDGNALRMDGTVIGPYALGEWHEITLQYHRAADEITVTYWINGEAAGSAAALLADAAAEDGLDHIRLGVGAGTGYFDDVVLTEISEPPSFPSGGGLPLVTVAENGSAALTVVVAGTPAPALQWQISTDGGVIWEDIPGATSNTLALTGLTKADAGKQFRVAATNDGGTAYSDSTTLAIAQQGTAVRTINGAFVAIVVTPDASVDVWAVEELLPADITPEVYGENNGSWDAVNRKLKWGPFFDTTARTLTYAVDGPDGNYAVTGWGSFDGSSLPITGDATLALPSGQYHPADTDRNWRLELNEVTAFGSAWKRGQHQYLNYTTRAGLLWKNGEAYHDTAAGAADSDSDATRWVTDTAVAQTATFSLKSRAAVAPLDAGTVLRTVSGSSVTIAVTPPAGIGSWAVEDVLPSEITPSEINENGLWDFANSKVKWGPFFDASARIFSYTVNGPAGIYSLSGRVSFDGESQSIDGDAQVVLGNEVYVTVNLPSGSQIPAEGGSFDILVSASGEWDATVDVDWLVVSPTVGTGNATVTVNATSANTLASPRNATVAISAGGVTRTVAVRQWGTANEPYLPPPDGDAELATLGSYDGFLYEEYVDTWAAPSAVRGTINVKVSKLTGALTAKATLQAGAVSFSAKAWSGTAGDGTRRVTVTARTGETLDLHVRQNRIWGSVSGDKAGGTLLFDGARNRFADKKDTAAQAVLSRFKGYYTTVVCGGCADFTGLGIVEETGALGIDPQGDGYLTVTVGNGGSAKVAGKLADGTSVSQAGRLLWFPDGGEDAYVPFFAPLYSKKGWIGGLLRLDRESRGINIGDGDGAAVWVNPGKGKEGEDGFTKAVGISGGWYDKKPLLADAYALEIAPPDDPLYYVSVRDGGEMWWDAIDPLFVPDSLPVTVSGTRLTIPKGTAPKKFGNRTEGYWCEWDDEKNPCLATLTFTASTGLFKGSFKLYYEVWNVAGTSLSLKSVSVPFAGAALQEDLGDGRVGVSWGSGHSLFPDNNPELKAYKLKRSSPVWLW